MFRSTSMADSSFDRLDPAVQHHVVNSLGWRSLRPLQEQAIDPVLDGNHVLLGAPTAGGKTEAAVLPLLSRIVQEDWGGLSVLYICPLRALLNNLLPRIAGYCELVGRRAAVWHGDVGDGERRKVLSDPPDVLLTTSESLEAMFLSRRVDQRFLLGSVRAVVVDEIHAFAGDDRGWHALAMLSRLDDLTGREIQRLGLTATVGNPEELLRWFVCGGLQPKTSVLVPPDESREPEIGIDYVGSVSNAAKVIAGLHRGEKRLVFADSRARVEDLAVGLRSEGVTTFVSHSSLSADERRQAERAFSEGRDCVIVATSTLELGIDVGDLDRVVQLGAPRTVASVLQRMGRTGRRAGSTRNYLFLCTNDVELLQALALERLLSQGWVEPLEAPAWPAHLVGQQLLARTLSAGRLAPSQWPGPLASVFEEAGLIRPTVDAIVQKCLGTGILIEADSGWQIGEAGEREFGRRHFMDVTSLFLTEPLLTVRWGQRVLGQVDPSSLSARDGAKPTILLAGQAWAVGDVDWNRQIVWVEPVDGPGRSRWSGPGGALSAQVCRALRAVLCSNELPTGASARAVAQVGDIRESFWWVEPETTVLEPDAGRTRWWTFAGGRANAGIAAQLGQLGIPVSALDDLTINFAGTVTAGRLREALASVDPESTPNIDARRLEDLKFSACLPVAIGTEVLARRDRDAPTIARAVAENVTTVGSA